MLLKLATRNLKLALLLLAFYAPSMAQDEILNDSKNPRAIMIREATLYLAPDTTSSKLAVVPRGREVAILDTSRNFLKVLASVSPTRDITGWIIDKGVVRTNTPNGDIILYGEAADSENEASRRHGRKGAAQDARRLYYRMAEYFPKSPLAGEAFWRAADIDWQLNKEDVLSRNSSKEMDPVLRSKVEDEFMHQVEKKFPNTKWADQAAYEIIFNKLCGEWRALAKCPEKETELYEDYVKKHPQSPKSGEALYEAAWRQSALIEIYKGNADAAKSANAKARAIAIASQIIAQYAQQGDWAQRATRLIYMIEQGIPTYGSASE